MRSILRSLVLLALIALVVIFTRDANNPTSNSYAAPSGTTQTPVPHAEAASASGCSSVAEPTGRIYPVATVGACAAAIPYNIKLFAQGKLLRFSYADRSDRPFAVVKDERQSAKMLFCAMAADEGAEAVSLYREGEVVQVSGDYMGVVPLGGNPGMPTLSDCRMAGSGDTKQAGATTASTTIENQSQQTFMTVAEFNAHKEFSTYTTVNLQGSVKGGRCGLVDEGREACWLLLEDVTTNEANAGSLMLWIRTWDWDTVHALYKVGDVAQMTCTAFGRGLYDCKAASR